MKPKPTIRDVAHAAGVSIKTVSRVSNGDDGVADGTAGRVREAISELGYRANPLARSLRTGSDEAVGLIVESIRDPFFAAVTDAVEEAARESGLVVIVTSAGRTQKQERAAVLGLLNRSLRGLLIVPCHLDYSAEPFRLGPGGVPVVFVDRPGLPETTDTVMIDNVGTARAATQHLIDRGHRRIAFAGTNLFMYPVTARLEGYREALEEAGIELDDSLMCPIPDGPDADLTELTTMLKRPNPATAVLSANALASLAVAGELHRAKRLDVALVSFDDFPMADALDPAISVASQDPVLMGRRAFELLLDRIDGDSAPGRHIVLPTTFIRRGSGEIPPPQPPEQFNPKETIHV